MMTLTAYGQTADLPDRPNRAPTELPIDPLPPSPHPIRIEPKAATNGRPAGARRARPRLRVTVREIRLEDSSLLSHESVNAFAREYLTRPIDESDIESIRRDLSDAYHDRGYLTSSIVVPDQNFKDGVLHLRAIEGRLTAIHIRGNKRLQATWLKRALRPAKPGPLDVPGLEERLQGVQRLPFIDQVRANLKPTGSPGESELLVYVTEAPPHHLEVESSNLRSAALGEYQGRISAVAWNALGWGDRLQVGAQSSRGFRDVNVDARSQLPSLRTTLSSNFRYAESEIVETPLAGADVESDYFGFRLGLDQPILQNRHHEVHAGFGVDWRRARSRVAGARFGFSEGADRGESQVVAFRPYLSWVRRHLDTVMAARIQASLGLPIPGTTNVPGRKEDARFASALIQLQAARRFPKMGGLEVLTRGDLQLAGDPLLSLEQFALGGIGSVRGYRANEIIRDNGVTGSIELRWPLLRRPNGRPIAQLGPFIDVAHGWQDERRSSRATKTLASVGFGFRISPIEWLHAEMYWGHPLTARRRGPDGAQEDGVHFRLITAYEW